MASEVCCVARREVDCRRSGLAAAASANDGIVAMVDRISYVVCWLGPDVFRLGSSLRSKYGRFEVRSDCDVGDGREDGRVSVVEALQDVGRLLATEGQISAVTAASS